MADKPRFVFDTNVIVSALLLRKSVARRAFDKAAKTGGILLSLAVIEELYEVLQSPPLTNTSPRKNDCNS